MIIKYIADEPLTLNEAKTQCKADDDDDDLLTNLVIPASRALAESKTGSAIRLAVYQEDFSNMRQIILPVGGVCKINSVKSNDVEIPYASIISRRLTVISTNTDASGSVTFEAGIDIKNYPDVKAWMLLACGWLYMNRELLIANGSLSAPPIAESLLSAISVPTGF